MLNFPISLVTMIKITYSTDKFNFRAFSLPEVLVVSDDDFITSHAKFTLVQPLNLSFSKTKQNKNPVNLFFLCPSKVFRELSLTCFSKY